MTLEERDKQYVWHPYTQMKDAKILPIIKGEGAYLWDEKGNKYIDAISSWWVTIHGHAHPYIANAIHEQFLTLEQVIFGGFTHPKAVELAERLLQKLPANQSKLFYSDNGSTAVEVALKMSYQYWKNKQIKRTKIIAFENSYHGDTFGAMSVSDRGSFTAPFHDLLFEVSFVPIPLQGKEEEAFHLFKTQIEKEDIAAFIFEPLIQGAGGMVIYSPIWLEKYIHLCKTHQVLTIADEVMTGFGRTGQFFATDHIQSKPDIFCLSKGITGGVMPLGVTSCTNDIYQAFINTDEINKTFYHGHSFTANPLSCAAACASLDLFEQENTLEKINTITLSHHSFLTHIKNHPRVKESRCLGTILALEIKTPQLTSYHNPFKEQIASFFMEKGILIRPLGNVLYLLPPYCISKEDMQYIYNTILLFLDQPQEN